MGRRGRGDHTDATNMNLYTDIDPKCCAWTTELIARSLIPGGIVDCRSITDIEHDLSTFTHVHFFNGIAGWALALDLAGWPRNRPVWCASLPCQSFSQAGKQNGFEDARGGLWQPFLGLVRKYQPATIFGEQVEGAVGHFWLDRVFTDLEAEGYACGAAVLGAHSVGAPHIRQRLFWVADAGRRGCQRQGVAGNVACQKGQVESEASERERMRDTADDCGAVGRLGHANDPRSQGRRERSDGEPDAEGREVAQRPAGLSGVSGGMEQPNGAGRQPGQPAAAGAGHGGSLEPAGGAGGVADTERNGGRPDQPQQGSEGRASHGRDSDAPSGDPAGVRLRRGIHDSKSGDAVPGMRDVQDGNGYIRGAWSDFTLIPCGDGKARRAKPSIFPLADAGLYLVPGMVRRRSVRADLLRGAGNCIVPEVAAEFIRVFLETESA